ncbi:MAG: iron dependent repressor, metal binding and dimerization domain protein [Corynebacterium sp.]|uniref:metal-dependent transcriptional regulator n=1 Tax=Corynebacterium sp. TaxID=1720 RepID=UPI0026DA8BD5|nr:metal-dependent transcriptional regulator [Corynebacterium sp.]MDO5029198.1 iron dependent repressor, metal binding and dimerization domain protein [Corynebacterium sp.]
MRDLVDTTEMYLRTIFELEEEGIIPLRARIAERLEQSGPTVSQTVARMERDGLLVVAPDRSLQLSDEGRKLATAVMRKHRLAELLLTDVIGLEWDKVHDEACRWEHVMSDEVEAKLLGVLDSYSCSPFGNPIPGLAEIGGTEEPEPMDNVQRLSDLSAGEYTITVVQINEILQVEQSYMKRLHKAGIMPGADAIAEVATGRVTLARGDHSLDIPDTLSHAIMVVVK